MTQSLGNNYEQREKQSFVRPMPGEKTSFNNYHDDAGCASFIDKQDENVASTMSLQRNMSIGLIILFAINILMLCGLVAALIIFDPTNSIYRYEIIKCGDANGVIHRCIRIDSAAGEINNPTTGARYRVIFGQ